MNFTQVSQWQNPARIDIQWVRTIGCQYWHDPARIWQEITNCRKTEMTFVVVQNIAELSMNKIAGIALESAGMVFSLDTVELFDFE